MTERDFDKIFRDKIGDELPYDFRPTDWLAAEQELDKMMPVATSVAPAPRFLTWHKWAAAAAVLLLGSQLYLMTALGKVKEEVVALHQENTTLRTSEKEGKIALESPQITVVQHDTAIKIIYSDVSKNDRKSPQILRGGQKAMAGFDELLEGQSPLKEGKEAARSVDKSANQTQQKNNLSAQKTAINLDKTLVKTPLNALENAHINEVKNEQNKGESKDVLMGQNKTNNNDLMMIKKEELNNVNSINKINSPDLISDKKDNLVDNNAAIKDNLNTDLKDNLIDNKTNELINANKDKSLLTALPNAQLTDVKSLNRVKNWFDDDAFDAFSRSKMPVIKPIAVPNGWEIGANFLFLANDEHRRPNKDQFSGRGRDDRGDERLSVGANLRLSYNMWSRIRLSADADFWSERHPKFDSIGILPPVKPNGFDLKGIEQNARSFQLRVGADYKFRQIIGLQPFIGLGLIYEKRVNDEVKFSFKNTNNETQLISVQPDNHPQFPISLGLRAGVEGKIYHRLSWSFDINAQKRANTLTSHLGLKYTL
jgi:hypothetical protein